MSQIKREVYIDGKLADVNDDSVAGYIFSSPIFRDIGKIFDNRTSTYTLPPTQHNLNIIGLSNDPKIDSRSNDFPYRKHDFEEWHDGILFIKGVCYFLQFSEKGIELSVFWGNTTKMQALKDKKLRELDSEQTSGYIIDESANHFMQASADLDFGYLKVDYGKGISDVKYSRPAVRVKAILDIIRKSTGIKIGYNEDYFEKIFTNTWIPLFGTKANDTVSEISYTGIASVTIDEGLFYLEYAGGNNSDIVNTNGNYFRLDESEKYKFSSNGIIRFRFSKQPTGDISLYKARLTLSAGDFKKDFSLSAPSGNKDYYVIRLDWEETFHVKNVSTLSVGIEMLNGAGQPVSGNFFRDEDADDSLYFSVTAYKEEVVHGDAYPIIPNLPDMTVVDFLKNIMNMFGLYTYYHAGEEDTIQLISANEIYDYKPYAYDCTRKIMGSGLGRYQLRAQYEDWAQRNWLRYTYDTDVEDMDADGYIEIDDETIADKKDLFTLAFSPSHNLIEKKNDKEVNIYARIPFYKSGKDDDDSTQDVKPRILFENVYDNGNNVLYKSAFFTSDFSFNGSGGLLTKYYKAIRHTLLRPVVLNVRMRFNSVELAAFRETTPMYIDGVYYMPLKVTANINGVMDCTLLKMPPDFSL